MKAKELERLLKKNGWYFKNQKGSHRHYQHPTIKGKVTIPIHNTDLALKTLQAILKQTGL